MKASNTPLFKMFFLLLISISPLALFGQLAVDYFLPAGGNNLSVYGVPSKKNLKFLEEIKTHVFYKASDDRVEMTTIYYDNDSIQSWTQQVFQIRPQEILLIKETSSNSGYSLQEESILFKLPTDNKKIEWEHPSHSGSTATTYSAKYSTVSIKGRKIKAIKVTTSTYKKKSKQELISTIDYYVAGIGLYKTTSDDFIVQQLEVQKQSNEFPAFK